MKSNSILLKQLLAAFCMVACMAGCKKDSAEKDTIVITANGNITSRLDEFRQLLGPTLNTTPGATGGHREINWEIVPDSLLGKILPNDFFNPVGDDPALAVRQKGLVYDGTSTFMVTNNNFATINTEASTEFSAFSGNRTFANVSNSLWPVDPQVPGKNRAATVKGFGVVFSDVDVANSTFIEFFNEHKSLGKFFAPVHNSASSFSFVGVYFKKEKVTRIQVGHDGFLTQGGKDISDGGSKDFVILDDFLFDEPVEK
jgi:hypothetical protein